MKEKVNTVHTGRTIMYEELSSLISHQVNEPGEIVELNILKKQTRTNIQLTLKRLQKLYDFEKQDQVWKIFLHLWKIANESDRRIMTLIYALHKDQFLLKTATVILTVPYGKKVAVEAIKEKLIVSYPEVYAPTTLHSAAQNIASSWKQAGYIKGKVRNIRVAVKPGFPALIFALMVGKSQGLTGEDLLKPVWVQALELSQSQMKELLSQAAMHDLITYQWAGGIIAFQFDKLLNHIE